MTDHIDDQTPKANILHIREFINSGRLDLLPVLAHDMGLAFAGLEENGKVENLCSIRVLKKLRILVDAKA